MNARVLIYIKSTCCANVKDADVGSHGQAGQSPARQICSEEKSEAVSVCGHGRVEGPG